jgi:hypothetical protein
MENASFVRRRLVAQPLAEPFTFAVMLPALCQKLAHPASALRAVTRSFAPKPGRRRG